MIEGSPVIESKTTKNVKSFNLQEAQSEDASTAMLLNLPKTTDNTPQRNDNDT